MKPFVRALLSVPFFRLAVPLASKAGFVRATSLYHLAAYYLRNTRVTGIVDGGAFDGADALYLAKLFGQAVILAFEPAPDSFNLLSRSVRQVRRIKPIQSALADKSGLATLNVNAFQPTNSILPSDTNADAEAMFAGRGKTLSSVTVPTVSLDQYVQQYPDFQCTLLKLDLQGYELRALHGAREVLRNSVLAVISEVRFKPLYVGDTLFSDIDHYLAGYEFQMMHLQEVTHHPSNHTTFEASALWLKL